MKKKKASIGIVILIFMLVGIAALFVFHGKKADDEEMIGQIEETVQYGTMEGESISGTGTTTAGTDYEYCTLSISERIPLVVEEVYVESGMEVTTQSEVLKVTDESYEATRTYLKKNLNTAKNDLSQAKLDYKVDLLSLKSDYSSQVAEAEVASEQYENTMETLANEVELSKSELEEAKQIIKEYPNKIKEVTTRLQTAKRNKASCEKAVEILSTNVKILEKNYNNAEENYTQLQGKLEEMKVVQNYIDNYSKSTQNTIENTTIGPTEYENFTSHVAKELEQITKEYTTAEQEYNSARQELEQYSEKLEKKQEKGTSLENKIEELTNKLETYETDLEKAKKEKDSLKVTFEKACADQITETISAKKELQQNLLLKEQADISYQMGLATLEDILEEAQNTYESAKETWNLFEKTFKNGTWYALSSGTLSYVGYEEGGIINSMTPILGYYNGERISVEVTVDQSEIASISVGDTVSVYTSSSRGSLEGMVSKIENTQNSTSASKVTYAVTVTIPNENGMLASGDSVSVVYRIAPKMIKQEEDEK